MSETVFTLPDLGEGLTEAELVKWLVHPGDTISVDAPVAEVETAKATVEVPSPFAGIIAELHGTEGSTIAVGAPLITVRPVEEKQAGSGNVLVGYGTTDAPARRRHRQATAVTPASPERPKIVSPVVRQLARRAGLDPATLVGTGRDGLITRADVERAIEAGRTPDARDVEAGEVEAGGVDRRTGLPVLTRVPLTGVRGHIARTLTRSRAEIPEATTWVDVDATALLALREDMRRGDWKPGLVALLARFVVAGLREFPALNSRVDVEREEVVHLDGVNLGVAAQTERGLVVPAVRGADRMSIRGLDTEIRRLTAAAREGTATAAELSSGSFTLNNYGVFGVDGSAAIINHPEAAILGIGRIIPRPWVVDGEVVPRQIAQLSLVFDHRVCDGGTAGGFLRFVADAVETPLRAVADL
ncbi:2-oxo acid dehydrogenase subunit E2 [Pseudonocardia sp. DSM 110487]|uniref:dihydrolipoamide acetyltransferase family protein n=1 Tax=Pseudonocardia sp. DSM 110487 TaxID=2865833 RepID=UPI001C6A3512|nr:dihydrolipoamide acetyltransferase family protein [Pseudonocardia sp. DSM 110487]QYN37466.1 2-oxo acid dehydrogenase subunit E2 [Pseudonocardia sp. DSM 110487]